MERMSCRAGLAALALLWLGGCSGAGRDATPLASSAPPAAAASQPVTSPASVPASAAEGRPAAGTAPPRAAPTADTTAELRDEILQLIGAGACRDDSQCRALPMGSKPCGGPEGYVAWSIATTDARRLETLALRYREARQARNQRLGLMSDCAVVPEPPVRCVPAAESALGGRCQAGPARGGPVPATR